MNSYLKIGTSAVIGATFGAIATYMIMERQMNWFDLVFSSARAEITVRALEDFDTKGASKGIEAVREMLKTELAVAKAKCDYFKCKDNPEKYTFEIRAIAKASQHLESITINNRLTVE